MAVDSYSTPNSNCFLFIFYFCRCRGVFFLFLCFNVAVATDDATAIDDTTMFLFVTMYIKREYTQMTQFSSHAFECFVKSSLKAHNL